MVWSSIKKFSPLALIVGYVSLYYGTKGIDRILPDLTGISFEKLTTKTQQWMMIGIALVAMYAMKHIKGIPNSIKVIATVVLYFLIGYNLATAIDPPVVSYTRGQVAFVNPSSYNPYGYGRR